MDSLNIGNRKIYKAFRAFLWYWTHAATWRTANRTHCYFNRGILLLPLVLDTCLDMKDSEQKAYLRWYCYPGFPLLPVVLGTRFDIKDSEHRPKLVLHVSAPTSTLHWWGPKRPKQRAPSLSAVWQLHPTWLNFLQTCRKLCVCVQRALATAGLVSFFSFPICWWCVAKFEVRYFQSERLMKTIGHYWPLVTSCEIFKHYHYWLRDME